jgi:hypothetical protein
MHADASDVYAELAARGAFTIKPAKGKPHKHTDPALTGLVILQRIAQGAYLDGPDGWARLLSDAITVTNNGEAFFVDLKSWTTNDTANRTAVSKLRAAIRAAIEPRIPRFGTPSAGRPRSKTAQPPTTKRKRSPPASAAAAASPATPASALLEAKRKEATGIQTEIRRQRRRDETIEAEIERDLQEWDVADAAKKKAEHTARQEKITAEQEQIAVMLEQESLRQALKDMDAKVAEVNTKVADANANETAKTAIRIEHAHARVTLVAAGVQKQANEDKAKSRRKTTETKVLAEIKELERNQRVDELKATLEKERKEKAAANANFDANIEAFKAELDMLRKRGGDGSAGCHDNAGSPSKRSRTDLSECCNCHDAAPVLTCMPCGHQCVCKDEECTRWISETKLCPICKSVVDELMEAEKAAAQLRTAGKRPFVC